MRYNSDQVIQGIMNYADSEIINKLPTVGKWIVGTGIGMASDKVDNIVIMLQGNAILKALDIVDDDGNFDVDALADHMKESANKYGSARVEIPLIGSMSFSAKDIENLRNYITRA